MGLWKISLSTTTRRGTLKHFLLHYHTPWDFENFTLHYHALGDFEKFPSALPRAMGLRKISLSTTTRRATLKKFHSMAHRERNGPSKTEAQLRCLGDSKGGRRWGSPPISTLTMFARRRWGDLSIFRGISKAYRLVSQDTGTARWKDFEKFNSSLLRSMGLWKISLSNTTRCGNLKNITLHYHVPRDFEKFPSPLPRAAGLWKFLSPLPRAAGPWKIYLSLHYGAPQDWTDYFFQGWAQFEYIRKTETKNWWYKSFGDCYCSGVLVLVSFISSFAGAYPTSIVLGQEREKIYSCSAFERKHYI
jgi:hypothetical protein